MGITIISTDDERVVAGGFMGGARYLGGEELRLGAELAPLPAQSTPPVPSVLPEIDRAANYPRNPQSRCEVPPLNVPRIAEAPGTRDLQDWQRLAREHDRALGSLCSEAGRGIKPGWRAGTPDGGVGHTFTVGQVHPKKGGAAVRVYAGVEGDFLSPLGVLSPQVVAGVQAVNMPSTSNPTVNQLLFDAKCSKPLIAGPEGPREMVCLASLYAKWK